MDKIIVTSYVDPDLDGFACTLAYAEFLNKTGTPAAAKIFGDPHVEAQYLMDKFDFAYPPNVELSELSKIALVDASELRDLDRFIKPENVIEVIDHRKVNDSAKFENAKIQIETVGAAATLIAEKFYEKYIDMSVLSATLLYGAIVSNTLDFRIDITTERDRSMAEWLNKKLHFGKEFAQDMFRAKSDMTGEKLSERIEADFAWFELGQIKIGLGQLEIVDAKELVKNRTGEIIEILHRLKTENSLDRIFISIIDLGQENNTFVSDEAETQILLAGIFSVQFKNNVALRPGFIMRKEIVPLLKAKLEKV